MDTAAGTSVERRKGPSRAVRDPRPGYSAAAPLPAFPRPLWGPPAGAQLPLSPRQMGRGVKTVIAAPDRVAVAARLLPAASRTGTASPGSAGVTDRAVAAGTRGAVRGSCPRLPASPWCRYLSFISCLPEERFLLQSNLHLIQSRQISS